MSEHRFDLGIKLGNAAMCKPEHVVLALQDAADQVERGLEVGRLRDLNGNTVGSWTVSYPEADDGELEE
jgi:hypothetical protein